MVWRQGGINGFLFVLILLEHTVEKIENVPSRHNPSNDAYIGCTLWIWTPSRACKHGIQRDSLCTYRMVARVVHQTRQTLLSQHVPSKHIHSRLFRNKCVSSPMGGTHVLKESWLYCTRSSDCRRIRLAVRCDCWIESWSDRQRHESLSIGPPLKRG